MSAVPSAPATDEGSPLRFEYIDTGILIEHLNELEAAGHTAETMRLRRWQISQWIRYIYPRRLDDVTREDVVGYLNGFPSLGTRRSQRAAVSTLYKWGRISGRLTVDPLVGMRPVKQVRGTPKPIPDDIFQRALETAAPNVADMMILARFAGLRCCEIATAHSTMLIGNTLHVTGKGGHTDAVPAHPRVVQVFDRHSGWFFPSHSPKAHGPHILPASVGQLVNDHLKTVAPGWTAHKLRHGFGSEIYKVSGDLLVTQKAMRHASPATTTGYAKLDDKRTREAIHLLAASGNATAMTTNAELAQLAAALLEAAAKLLSSS